MGYRKIEVNGTVYEYTIGRTHTKFRGNEKMKAHAVINEDIGRLKGTLIAELVYDDEIGEEVMSATEVAPFVITVETRHIKCYILSHTSK